MPQLTNADLRSVIDVLHDLAADRAGDLFPRSAIERLGVLLDAPNAGYCEWNPRRSYNYYTRTFPEPQWFGEVLLELHHQDATSFMRFSNRLEAIAASDVLSKRAFDGVELYQHTLRSFGFIDTMKLFLPPGESGEARFFFFDRERWGLTGRERQLLELLRPHLVLHRKSRVASPELQSLTPREREILDAVAKGDTNAQIAERLWISPYTVRAHLEHIFEKLNVKTRTEAAARLSAVRN